VATVVGTEERYSKQQVAETLRCQGFKVLELPAQDGKANQVDDRALMREMLEKADQLDEVVLLTADGDYVDTVKALIRKGLRVKIEPPLVWWTLKDRTSKLEKGCPHHGRNARQVPTTV
jgi:uncharacterized LabA/DUF88 family protein